MRRRTLVAVVPGLILAAAFGAYRAGSELIAPQLRSVGEPPASIQIHAVSIDRPGLAPVAGWYGRPGEAEGAVLLLHGVRADRRAMVGRAAFLLAAGYAVLLIDLQAHGETRGDAIGFGYLESRDVVDAVAFLKAEHTRIGIVGVSLGGAATILAAGALEVQAVVAEAVYSNISKAAENRLRIRLGALGPYLAPLLLWQIEPRLGIPIKALSPADAVADLHAPLMVVAGELDRRTTPADSQALFDRANHPKQLWVVAGAAHQDYHAYSKGEYEQRVLQFFERYLRLPDR